MKRSLLVAATIALAGCASPLPTALTGPDPANSTAPVLEPRYVPVTVGTVDYRPVEPRSWRGLNERVAPGGRRTQ